MKKLLLSLIALCSFTGMLWSQTTTEIQTTYNGYINEGSPTTTLGALQIHYDFQVKKVTGYSRWGYLEFPLTNIDVNAGSISLRIYLSGNPPITDYPTTDVLNSTPAIVLGVNKINYSFDKTLTWNNKTTPDGTNEVSVGTLTVTDELKSTWLSFDITSLAKSMKTAGQTYIRFRFFVADGTGTGQLLHFRQMEMDGSTIKQAGTLYPRLIQDNVTTGINKISKLKLFLYPSIASKQITVTGTFAEVFDIRGKLVLKEVFKNNQLDISNLCNGMYIVKTESGSGRFIKQ